MVTKIYLIRHGETEDAEPVRYKGHLDVPLSEKGITQMRQLARYIVKDSSSCSNRLSAIYCSDLSRAMKSAEIIAEPFGLEPIIMPELRERNFGEWEGMTFKEIEEKWPDAFKRWANNPLKHSPLGGESTTEVRDRVIKALNRILNEVQYSSSRSNRLNRSNGLNNISIVIVAHGGVNRIIICEILGMPLENIFRIEQDYGTLNIIEFRDRYPVVKLINGRLSKE